jgi:hypothetical protein
MRIYPSPVVIVGEQKAPLSSWHRHAESGTFSHLRSSLQQAYFFHITVLLMPSGRISFHQMLMLQNCCAVMAARRNFESTFFT